MARKTITIDKCLHEKLKEISDETAMPLNKLLDIAAKSGIDAAIKAASKYKELMS
jgi:hypothetical protein